MRDDTVFGIALAATLILGVIAGSMFVPDHGKQPLDRPPPQVCPSGAQIEPVLGGYRVTMEFYGDQ